MLNLIEGHLEQIHLLKEQVQLLRDEIARLKGQQGKPSVKPNKPAADHSSEAHRRLPAPWHKKPKRDLIEVTHTCETLLDLANLPRGCDSHFGPGVKSLVLWLGYQGNMSQNAIHALLSGAGVKISTGQVNRLLVTGQVLNLGASWEAA